MPSFDVDFLLSRTSWWTNSWVVGDLWRRGPHVTSQLCSRNAVCYNIHWDFFRHFAAFWPPKINVLPLMNMSRGKKMHPKQVRVCDLCRFHHYYYYWDFYVQLLGCFWPWILFYNIWSNMLPPDSFLSNLYSQQGYSTEEFQALQLIFLEVFGGLDWPFAYGMLPHTLES